MGNSTCCKRDESDSQANMDIDKTKSKSSTIPKTQLQPSNPLSDRNTSFPQDNAPPLTNNLLQSIQSPIIEPAINRESLDNLPVRASHHRQSHKHWNDISGDIEDLIFDISDDKSESIFIFFNLVRTQPRTYIQEGKSYGVDSLLSKAANSGKIPSLLCRDESYYYELREVLMCCYNETPRSEDEIVNEIKEISPFKKYNVNAYVEEVLISNPLEAVWTLLQERNAYNDILIKKVDYCVVCAIPLKNTDNMKVYFVLLENKMRESAIY